MHQRQLQYVRLRHCTPASGFPAVMARPSSSGLAATSRASALCQHVSPGTGHLHLIQIPMRGTEAECAVDSARRRRLSDAIVEPPCDATASREQRDRHARITRRGTRA